MGSRQIAERHATAIPTAGERLLQRAALALVLDRWPIPTAIDTLAVLMSNGRDREGETEEIFVAVAELEKAGLMTVTSSRVSPTAAALRYRLLEEER